MSWFDWLSLYGWPGDNVMVPTSLCSSEGVNDVSMVLLFRTRC